ncbi:MAG TPA: EAL domain-containing protein [Steroidobacteraceae bacterium]|jgi:diguanylate cyclase (GGDEF)-like protein/PAS domain S-box-containing protein|nr:EAL domain-containing protein [Steroidobacteraceae bacterium]
MPDVDDLNPLLERQIAAAGHGTGEMSLATLLKMVSAHYDRIDGERRGIVRSMQLMSDEAQALTREIREENASHLQAILDNVKDAIVTLNESGHIETINPTGERIFCYAPSEVLGRSLEVLLPDAAAGAASFLERFAVKIDDTHVDLAAHQTFGRTKDGNRVAVEIAVSKARLDWRDGYILSIRDITERRRADGVAAGERRVFEKIAANAPLKEALESICELIEQAIPDSVLAISLLDPERRVLTYGVAPHAPRELAAAMDGTPVTAGFGSCAGAVSLGRPVAVADIETDAHWEHRRAAARLAGVRACWSTPIMASDGEVVGTLAVYLHRPGSPAARDEELISKMAPIAGIAIERRAAEDALRDSERKFRGLFETMMEGVYQTSRDGRILEINPAFVNLLGYSSAQEIQAQSARALYWSPADRDTFERRMESEGELRNQEYALRRKDGSMVVVLDSSRVVLDAAGRIVGYEGTLTDITERKRAETAVFQAKERAQVTLQSIGDAVITTDSEGRIDYMNPVAESLTGWESREAQSHFIGEVMSVVDETTGESTECPITRCLREGQVLGLSEHTVLLNRRGQELAIQDSAAPIRDREGNLIGAVMVFHDASRERRLHRALHYQASHDALTGLINRREFENRLTAAVESARHKPDARHALLYLDLDQFKLVNDTCGHPAGDQLLKQITGVLQSRLRAGDTLARLGGDEFGILLQSCALDQALRVADGVRQAIRDFRFMWQDSVLQVGVSIGIVEITRETQNVASVMSAADVACYSAKDLGRDRVQLYKPDEVPERHREMHWVSKLARACDESRFELYFQPIVPTGANRREHEREHFELMLRLRDDHGALVAPAEFIPAAERYNVMPSIDRWVVRQALDRLVHRSGLGLKPFTVAVNLSGTSLNDERFLEYLIAELSTRDLVPGAICFEITETAAISNLANVVFFMRELRARGCHFALDDFGNGLSSFMYLKTLPVDYLKIDGQFVENVVHDRVDRSMVEAISQVGRTMGIETIAEKVESQEVLAELALLGIGYAQGIHIAPPRTAREFPYLR